MSEATPCKLYDTCKPGSLCLLANQVVNQAKSGGAQDANGQGSGGPYWEPKVWDDFCNRTREMVANGCGNQDAVDRVLAEANPIFIR